MSTSTSQACRGVVECRHRGIRSSGAVLLVEASAVDGAEALAAATRVPRAATVSGAVDVIELIAGLMAVIAIRSILALFIERRCCRKSIRRSSFGGAWLEIIRDFCVGVIDT